MCTVLGASLGTGILKSKLLRLLSCDISYAIYKLIYVIV